MTELAGIIILGILAQWLAWRIKVPAILPLILIGLLVGPIATLFTSDGCKLIQPMQESGGTCGNFLFPGEYLFYFVSLSIGIILFEGGLTLKRKEIQGVGPAILKLISVGSLITFIGAGFAAHFLMGLNWAISFLFSALIIVTGPTVIAPILQNVPLKQNLTTVLKWEGILIDPIGALTAVLVFEFIISGGGGHGIEFTTHAFQTFFKIVLIGLASGTLTALAFHQMLKRKWVPHYLLNVVTLALVLGLFVGADFLEHESGLLSVVVMGMVLGNMDVPYLKDILFFKESISILLISILFILLAANINIDDLQLLLDWRCLALFLTTILVIRPLGVFTSTHGSDLNFKEKLFISWVGPRGIVAAGIASLFGLKLVNNGVAGSEYITPLVFMIVLGTVLLNATTARLVARLLGLTLTQSDGVLLIGANPAARIIGQYLNAHGRHVVIVDNNPNNVEETQAMGLESLQANIYTEDLDDQIELIDMGYLMALTSSDNVNQFAISKFQKNMGENGTFRLVTTSEMSARPEELPSESLFSPSDDYIHLMEVVRTFPTFHEKPINTPEEFQQVMVHINQESKSIPMFLKNAAGELTILNSHYEDRAIAAGGQLVYLGRKLEDILA